MQASARGVDFLIVTALPGEFEAVRMLLVEQEPFAHGIVAKIGREGSTAKYTVALTEIGGMGTNEAQAVAGRVLNYCTPARVILTGITAGFPELNVKEGDILVPYGVVPYELAKITEKSVRIRWWARFWRGRGKRLGYEHRGIAIAVSHGLWHAANSLGEDTNTNWPGAIRESRPDGTCDRPKVHSAGFSILGSGEKIVGSEFAEARLWLREQFPRQAIGLEMESYGVLKACHVTDTPFLVIKASQDPATAQKDETGEKDKWRKYAMEAAAAFTTALIRRFELESFALVLEHIKQVQELARDYERIAPKPVFTYTVSRAASYSLLKEGIYDSKSEALTALIPSAATQQIALHSGGGTGKTRIVRLLLNPMLDADLCPLILDLKEYSIRGKYVQGAVSRELFLADMLQVASKPPRTLRELEHLANQASLVVLVDGLNEISREARTALISYLKSLNCYLLTTDRLGTAESLEGFCPLTVDKLDRSTVQSVLHRDLGVNFDDLDKDLQRVYQRPFFLNLAVKAKGKFTGTRVWSGIFEEFFRNHLHLTHEKLDEVARATLTAHMPGTFPRVRRHMCR